MVLKYSLLRMQTIGIFILITLRFYSFIYLSDEFYVILELLSELAIIFFLFKYIKERGEYHFSFLINTVVIFTLLSAIPAYLFHNQTFIESILAYRSIIFLLFYYLLHKLNIDAVKLQSLLFKVGFMWCIIMISQQLLSFTLFNQQQREVALLGADRVLEQRGGLTRIFVLGTEYGYIFLFLTWRRLYDRFSTLNLIYFTIAVAAIIFTATRQFIVGSLGIILFDFILSIKFNIKTVRLIAIAVCSVLVVFYVAGDFLFSLIQLSKDQEVTSDDYIRSLEINFFLNSYWPNKLCYFLGNGWEYGSSAYGNEMINTIQERYKYYRSDIGLIGALNKFGALYVVGVIAIYYKMIFSKKLVIPRYIKLLFIMCVLTSISANNYFEISASYIALISCIYIAEQNTFAKGELINPAF
jgi:hypothetical protein